MRGSRVLLSWSVLAAAALAAAVCPILARKLQRAERSTPAHGERSAIGRDARAHPDERVTKDVAGLAGELATAHDVRLRVRIARLNPDPARQLLDRTALARHFGLGAGEPFLCELSSSGAGLVPRGALRWITVRDERGVALAPFQPPVPAPGEPADPLAALLSPPLDELAEGRAVSVILWGREPGNGARLSGLDAGEVVLAPAHMTARELDTALARIDAQAPAGAEVAK